MNQVQHALQAIFDRLLRGGTLTRGDTYWLFSHLPALAGDQGASPLGLESHLQAFTRRIEKMSHEMDKIAADWPTLREAITAKLREDTGKIAELTSELAGLDADDPRAEEIDGEMKELLAQVQGVVTQTPAPASDSSASASQGTGSSVEGSTAGKVSG